MPRPIITEEYLVQKFCKCSYFWVVFLNSNNQYKKIKLHDRTGHQTGTYKVYVTDHMFCFLDFKSLLSSFELQKVCLDEHTILIGKI